MDSDSVLELMYRKKAYLKPALRRIADFALENPDLVKTTSISDLASACDVAESTVSRFVKEIGLANFQSFKIAITEAISNTKETGDAGTKEKYFYEDVSQHDSIDRILHKVMHRNIQTLQDTAKRLNVDQVEQAVRVIESVETLVFTCMGSSAVAGEEAVMRFTRAGKKCLFFRDESQQLMTAAILTPGVAMIGISNSGNSVPVVSTMKLARDRGIPTIGITSFEHSHLVHCSDVVLLTPTQSPPPGLNLYGEATTSVGAQILVIDSIYACYAVRNFDETVKHLEATYATAIRGTRFSQ
jgi:RpiR family carbohydrate utilization transcriptional regulator